MKTNKLFVPITSAIALALVGSIVTGATAEPLARAITSSSQDKDGKQEFVLLTGSRIPRRVQLKANGTNTTEPRRVYTREEIERTGQFTTAGILAQDPSLTLSGHGSDKR